MPAIKTHPCVPNAESSRHEMNEYEPSLYSVEEISVNAFEPIDPADNAVPQVLPHSNRPRCVTATTDRDFTYIPMGSRDSVELSFCPKCDKSRVKTIPHTKVTEATWASVAVGAFVFWPLCWLPLVITPFKQTNHYCANCGCKVGRDKPFGKK